MGAVLKLREQKPHGARSVVRMFPVKYRGGDKRFLYAVGLIDGRIKIGVASRPRDRIRQYLSTHDGLKWAHLFAPVDEAFLVEQQALKMLQSMAGVERQGNSEFFRNATREQAIAAVRAAVTPEAA